MNKNTTSGKVKEGKVFILGKVMMPLFMAKKMVEFVNNHSLTMEEKTLGNMSEGELKSDMMPVQISFASKSCADRRIIVKEIRRLADKHDIFVFV